MKDIKATVYAILLQDKAARDSDKHLYIEVCRHKCPEVLSMSLENAFKLGQIPNYESVRRARQWVQAKYPNLGASEQIEYGREVNEQLYIKEFRA